MCRETFTPNIYGVFSLSNEQTGLNTSDVCPPIPKTVVSQFQVVLSNIGFNFGGQPMTSPKIRQHQSHCVLIPQSPSKPPRKACPWVRSRFSYTPCRSWQVPSTMGWSGVDGSTSWSRQWHKQHLHLHGGKDMTAVSFIIDLPHKHISSKKRIPWIPSRISTRLFQPPRQNPIKAAWTSI